MTSEKSPPASSRTHAISALLALLACIAASAQSKPSSGLPQTSSELAVLAASKGWAGGIVTVLSPEESKAVTRMQALDGYEHSANGFRVLMRSVRRGPEELRESNGPLHSAGVGFSEFASRRSSWNAESVLGVDVARDRNAGFCNATLRRRLSMNVEGRDIRDLLAKAVRSATGAQVPGGFLGSCAGQNEVSASPMRLAAGLRLEDVLNQAVATFGGAVWVAAQSGAGDCSIGLVLQGAEPGKVCVSTIAASIRKRD